MPGETKTYEGSCSSLLGARDRNQEIAQLVGIDSVGVNVVFCGS
jgi:hypothetical protein